MRNKILASALAAGFLLTGAQFAAAQDKAASVYVFPRYPTYSVDQPPYFAQNPPVYYSYPVKRSYGISPYPYPYSGHCPNCSHPEAPAPAETAPAPAPARRLNPLKDYGDERVVSRTDGYTSVAYTSSSGSRVRTITFD